MGDAYDRCAEDLLIKFGAGVLGGAVGSFIFKNKGAKMASVGFGAGVGVGCTFGF